MMMIRYTAAQAKTLRHLDRQACNPNLDAVGRERFRQEADRVRCAIRRANAAK